MWLAALLLFLVPVAVNAQNKLKVVREKVLSKGEVILKTYSLFPLEKNIGRVKDQDIIFTGAKTIRLHFVINSAPESPTWAIRVLDREGREVWTYEAKQGQGGDLWSNEVRGDKAIVEVYSVEKDNSLNLSIDRLAVTRTKIFPQSIKEPNQMVPIAREPSTAIKNLGKSVARLNFIGDEEVLLRVADEHYYCTGFLISDDLLITNHHCPQTEKEWRSTEIFFDYDSETARPKSYRFKEFITANPELDYAIYRLNREVTDRPSLLLSSAVPLDGSQLFLIHHPGGKPKYVTKDGCLVQGLNVFGTGQEPTDFGHVCDTEGGSSGSPIFDPSTSRIVGLHHLGYYEDAPEPEMFNRAVLFRLIIEDLQIPEKNLSRILQELKIQ
jgi:hypothetical protein